MDLDGDGCVQPLTDGLILIRYLFGLTNESLILNALGQKATRKLPKEIIHSIDTMIDRDRDGFILSR